jgi:hypothetical protein
VNFPADTPTWVEELLTEIKDEAERKFATADTADKALRAAGALSCWRKAEELLEVETKKQQLTIKQRNERLNARNEAS